MDARPFRATFLVLFALLVAGRAALADDAPVRVDIRIPPSYGAWTLDDEDLSWTGPRTARLSEGAHRIDGALGWSLDFAVSSGNVVPRKATPGLHGRTLDGLLCYGARIEVPPPSGRRVILAVPAEAGAYRIERLLPEGTGHRAVRLPEGTVRVLGPDWSARIEVRDGELSAEWDDPPDGAQRGEPALTIDEDHGIVHWPAQDRPEPSAPDRATLRAFTPRGRRAFRRDERVTVALCMDRPEAATVQAGLRALAGDRETVLWAADWAAPAGRGARAVEFPAGLLRPGTYVLRVAAGDLHADLPLRILPAGEDQHIGVTLLAGHVPDDARAAARSGATAWLLRGSLARAEAQVPVRARMEAATREGLTGYLFSADARRLGDAARAHPAAAQALGRSNALLAQRARSFACYAAFVQGGRGVGGWDQKILTRLRAFAHAPEADVGYAAVVDAQALPDATPLPMDPILLDCRRPVESAHLFDRLAPLAHLRGTHTVLAYGPSDLDAWLALAQGAQGVVLGADHTAVFTRAARRLADTLAALPVADFSGSSPLDAQSNGPLPHLRQGPAQVHGPPLRRAGAAYLWTVNAGEPCTAHVAVPEPWTAAYDLMSLQQARVTDGDLVLDLNAREVRLCAFLPRPVHSVQVRASRELARGGTASVSWTAVLLDGNRDRLSATLPAEVLVRDSAGEARVHRRGAFVDGELTGRLALAANDPPGAYAVTVSCTPAHVSGTAHAAVSTPPAIRGVRELAPLEIADKRIVHDWLGDLSRVLVVPGSARELGFARRIADALRARDVDVLMRLPNELLALRHDLPFGPDGAQVHVSGPQVAIDRDVILLGIGPEHALIDRIMNVHGLTPHPCTPFYPGPGRGLVEFAWRAFDPEQDTVVLTGSDAAGVARAAEHLIRAAGGR